MRGRERKGGRHEGKEEQIPGYATVYRWHNVCKHQCMAVKTPAMGSLRFHMRRSNAALSQNDQPTPFQRETIIIINIITSPTPASPSSARCFSPVLSGSVPADFHHTTPQYHLSTLCVLAVNLPQKQYLCKFPTECNSEKNLKIGHYLAKLLTRV